MDQSASSGSPEQMVTEVPNSSEAPAAQAPPEPAAAPAPPAEAPAMESFSPDTGAAAAVNGLTGATQAVSLEPPEQGMSYRPPQQRGSMSCSGSPAFGPRIEPHEPAHVTLARCLFTRGAENFDQPVWRYIDNEGNVQGPFPASQMLQWWKARLITKTLYACGCTRAVAPPNLPNLSFYKPLSYLLELTAANIPYTPVTPEDAALPAPPPGWNTLPVVPEAPGAGLGQSSSGARGGRGGGRGQTSRSGAMVPTGVYNSVVSRETSYVDEEGRLVENGVSDETGGLITQKSLDIDSWVANNSRASRGAPAPSRRAAGDEAQSPPKMNISPRAYEAARWEVELRPRGGTVQPQGYWTLPIFKLFSCEDEECLLWPLWWYIDPTEYAQGPFKLDEMVELWYQGVLDETSRVIATRHGGRRPPLAQFKRLGALLKLVERGGRYQPYTWSSTAGQEGDDLDLEGEMPERTTPPGGQSRGAPLSLRPSKTPPPGMLPSQRLETFEESPPPRPGLNRSISGKGLGTGGGGAARGPRGGGGGGGRAGSGRSTSGAYHHSVSGVPGADSDRWGGGGGGEESLSGYRRPGPGPRPGDDEVPPGFAGGVNSRGGRR